MEARHERKHAAQTHERWQHHRNRRHGEDGYLESWYAEQCGMCEFWIPLAGSWGADYGVCSSAASPFDSRVMFEHDGCDHFSQGEAWAVPDDFSRATVTARDDVLALLKIPGVWMDSEIGDLRGASEAQVSGLEERTGLLLPASLRDWLSICNGAYIGADGTYGVAPDAPPPDIETVLTYWTNWVSKGWIPIAGDQTGNYYMVGTKISREPEGVVFFVDTHQIFDDPWFVVGSDIWHFLKGYLSCELGEDWWPFDQEHVLASDPGLAQYGSLVFPWDRDRASE